MFPIDKRASQGKGRADDEIDRTNFLFRSLSLEKLSHSRICLHESKLCNIYGPLRSLLKKNPWTLTVTVSRP